MAAGSLGIFAAFGAFSWVLRRRREQAAQATSPPPVRRAGRSGELVTPAMPQPRTCAERFGRYSLIERIGEGGMAEVFTA